MSQNLTAQAWRNRKRENVLETMEEMLSHNGRGVLREGDLEGLSKKYGFSKANLKGAAEFYDFLRCADKKIRVCNGTACLNAGTQPGLKRRLKKHFQESEIGEVNCVGRCHHNHSVLYQSHTASCPDDMSLEQLLQNKNLGEQPHPYFHLCADRSLIFPHLGLKDDEVFNHYHQSFLKYKDRPSEILTELKASQLRGRGGAGFPFAIKISSFLEATEPEKYIICNADEGDPGAWSDRYILEYNPFAVLFGMAYTAYLTGAQLGILYVRAEYPECHRSIKCAIDRWEASELAEKMGMNFHFKLVKGHGSYVCGEETALINAIEGKRGEVRVKPPLPVVQGLYGKPTLVSNVETLANVPWIVANGGKAFAQMGSAESKGSKLISTDALFKRPGLYEVPMGMALKDFIYDIAGGFTVPVKAIQIGGPLGSVIATKNLAGLEISFESLKGAGYALGHGSIVCIPESLPMKDFLCHLFEFCARESCGKCFPCRIGTQRGFELWQAAGKQKINSALHDDLLDTLELTSLCALGGGLPLPVRNVLEVFSEELAPFFTTNEQGGHHE